jgi:hypothetical protein
LPDDVDHNLPIRVEDIDNAPATLPVPANIDWFSEYHKISEKFKLVSDENFQLKEINSRLVRESIENGNKDGLMKPIAWAVFVFMCAYFMFAAVAVLFNGEGLIAKISDGVLISMPSFKLMKSELDGSEA